MAKEAKLEWEARAARPAAAAAFGAVALLVAGAVAQLPAVRHAPGRNDPDRHKQTLLNFKEHASSFLISSVLQALAVFCAAGALYYLYRATRHRRPELPGSIVGLLGLVPILLLAAALISYSAQNDAANDFARSPVPLTASSGRPAPPTRAQLRKARSDCRGRPSAGCITQKARVLQEDSHAEHLIKDAGPLGPSVGVAGTLGLAGVLVFISLNAMRVGLLSRFLGVLGVITGVLLVLPLPAPVPVVEIFWFGALGVIFLGHYRAGRGPAWEVAVAVPWPSAAERAQEAGRAPAEDGSTAPRGSDEKRPQPRPASRKRKRKKRR